MRSYTTWSKVCGLPWSIKSVFRVWRGKTRLALHSPDLNPIQHLWDESDCRLWSVTKTHSCCRDGMLTNPCSQFQRRLETTITAHGFNVWVSAYFSWESMDTQIIIHVPLSGTWCLACFSNVSVLMFVGRSKIKKWQSKIYQGWTEDRIEKLTLLQEREREKELMKHIGEEAQEKSLINSGYGTCGAGQCLPNIPEGWRGWGKGPGEGCAYADEGV